MISDFSGFVTHKPPVPWVKGKGRPKTGHIGPERELSNSSTLSLTCALDGGAWSTPRPGRSTAGKDPIHIVFEALRAPGPVWTGA